MNIRCKVNGFDTYDDSPKPSKIWDNIDMREKYPKVSMADFIYSPYLCTPQKQEDKNKQLRLDLWN